MNTTHAKVDDEILRSWKNAIKLKKICKWREAADCEKNCARLFKSYLKKPLNAAIMFTEVSSIVNKSDICSN